MDEQAPHPTGDDESSTPFASWFEVPDKYRGPVDEVLRRFVPAPRRADGAIDFARVRTYDGQGLLDFAGFNINDEILIALVKHRLRDMRGILRLRLYGCSVGSRGVRALAASDAPFSDLQTLELGYNVIGPTGAKWLAAPTSCLANLRSLDLAATKIGDSGVAALAAPGSPLTRLTSLNLYNCDVGPEGGRALASPSCPFKGLTHLLLASNRLATEGVQLIASDSGNFRQLQQLDLSGNNCGDDGVAALANEFLPLPRLEALNLSGNGITDWGARILGSVSSGLRSLTYLSLNGNPLGNAGLIELFHAQHPLGALRDLLLAGCDIGPEGAAALAHADPPLSALDSLDLDRNPLGPRGAAALAGPGSALSRLRTLNLNECELESEGIAALARSGSVLSVLKDLQVSGNKVDVAGAKAISDHRSPLRKLVHLGLRDNQLGNDGVRALAQATVALTELESLNLSNNEIDDPGAVIDLVLTLGEGRSGGGSLKEIAVGENQFRDDEGSELETRGLSMTPMSIDSVLSILSGAIAIDALRLRDVRVVLVGVGGVGKSQLAGALGGSLKPGQRAEPYTKGLQFVSRDFVLPADAAEKKQTGSGAMTVRVRFMDIGGQAEQFSIHALLFERSRNAVMLVCSAIKAWGWLGNRGEYFLRMLHAIPGRAERDGTASQVPAIGVVTQIDKVSERYPELTMPDTIRNAAAKWKVEVDVVDPGIDALQQKVRGSEEVGLDPVEAALRSAILRVRPTVISRTFEAFRESATRLFESDDKPDPELRDRGLAAFEQAATDAGETDVEVMKFYLRTMHALGDLIWFEENDALSDRVINVHWAREAMYRLLTSDVVRDNRGILSDDEWKQISRDDRPGLLTELMRELRLMHEVSWSDPATGTTSRVRLVPDMLGYAPSKHGWADLPPACSVVNRPFLWESVLLQFLGNHAEEVVRCLGDAHRDQSMLRRADGTRVLVRADFESDPMAIRFYADPTDATGVSRAWCFDLARRLPGKVTTSHAGDGTMTPYPHPNADTNVAQKMIQLGAAFYARQQNVRFTLSLITIALALASLAVAALVKSSTLISTILGAAALAMSLVEPFVDRHRTKVDAKRAAEAFQLADHILMDGKSEYLDTRDEEILPLGRKQLSSTRPEEWYIDLDTIKEYERRKLAAVMQEAEFRTVEHKWSAMTAFFLAAACLLVPLSIVYLWTSDREQHWALGILPFGALTVSAVMTGFRNYDAWKEFKALLDATRKRHNEHVDGGEALSDVLRAGDELMVKMQALRESMPPVCWWVYDRHRASSNKKCRQCAELISRNQRFRK
jgi:Ran GTPase-activating protein (RanGAP) involved in mRNA processing and transport